MARPRYRRHRLRHLYRPSFSHRAFADAEQLFFTLLSDSDGSVAEAYDVLYDEFQGHKRIAARIWDNFLEPCDLGLDFHTPTRGRTNMFHARADMEDADTARLANAFGTNVIMASDGSAGMLRTEATAAGIPTITIEMGEAHRFERALIDHTLDGVRSVFAEYNIYPQETVRWPGWRTTIEGWDEKTWLRADDGGIVDMRHGRGDLVHAGDLICRIASPFEADTTDVTAPFTGILVGLLENPVVYPGNPLCHFVKVDEQITRIIESKTPNGHHSTIQ